MLLFYFIFLRILIYLVEWGIKIVDFYMYENVDVFNKELNNV